MTAKIIQFKPRPPAPATSSDLFAVFCQTLERARRERRRNEGLTAQREIRDSGPKV